MAKQSTGHRRAIVFAPFFSADMPTNRPRFIGSVLAEFMPVDVVTTDFDHGSKQKRQHRQCEQFEKVVYLEGRPYKSNVSPARLISHLVFAFNAAAYFKKHRDQYDVVYASVPLNFLSWLLFRRAGKRTKIIDVIDIWPDVLPFPQLLRRAFAPLFILWKWFFKSGVHKADIVLAVSDRFLDEANRYANRFATSRRFYIGHEALVSKVHKQCVFTVVYVGNLGRLYDFETLLDVLADTELREQTQMFVIGEGDRRRWLVNQLERRNIRYRYFGTIIDTAQLAEILRSCHVGFNGYINTSAAFSYKASTYFAAGLPIVNSMGGDLRRLVAELGLGENYEAGHRMELKEALLHLCRNGPELMADNCERFFDAELDLAKVRVEVKDFFTANLGGAYQSAVVLSSE
jgi:glycosyltransferase involved in cell wall biosynthesis